VLPTNTNNAKTWFFLGKQIQSYAFFQLLVGFFFGFGVIQFPTLALVAVIEKKEVSNDSE